MLTLLVTGWVWFVIGIICLAGLPVVAVTALVTAPFDRGRYHAGRLFRLMGVACVKVNPYWTFETAGVTVRDPRRPYVAVSNHESYADIFLISHLPWEMKWLAKAEIFAFPVMGWLMRLAGDVPVMRGDSKSGVEALERCRDRLRKRVSVMIFPEGTRSKTTELLPFRDGAFRLAVETGAPILPIAVAGTRHAMAKGSFYFRKAHAVCRVLEPVETAGLTVADVPGLRRRVQGMIDEARRALQHELGIAPTAAELEAQAADRAEARRQRLANR